MQKLKNELNPSGRKSTASDGGGAVSSDSDCSEGDYVENLPVTINKGPSQKARMSVSAEVFGKFNLEKEYVPPVYPKEKAQLEAI